MMDKGILAMHVPMVINRRTTQKVGWYKQRKTCKLNLSGVPSKEAHHMKYSNHVTLVFWGSAGGISDSMV
jgi:hypothetical protein